MFIIYKSDTGEIDSLVSTNVSPSEWLDDGLAYIETYEHVDPSLFYIDDGEVRERPQMGIVLDREYIDADGIDEATISRIPDGAACFLNGEMIPTPTDGAIVFSTDAPGFYRFRISRFPYKDAGVVIHAV
jgi:hypothetical protein